MKRCSAAELMSESSTTRPSLSHSQNGLSADQQQREEEQRENCKVCTPLHWGLKQQFPGYEVRQHNIIVDACGGWSWEVYQIVGGRRKEVPKIIQKAVLLGMINNYAEI